MNKILIFIVSLFILSPSEVMGLNRLWRSLSFKNLYSLENLEERPETVMGVYSDPIIIEYRNLDLFNKLAEKYYITNITLKNKGSAKCKVRFFFDNSKTCLRSKKISYLESCEFLKKDLKHKILFFAKSKSDLRKFIFYKIELNNEKKKTSFCDEYKLTIILNEELKEEVVNIDIKICFSVAFNFNLFGFNTVYTYGNVVGAVFQADNKLDSFDYRDLNANHLIYNKNILI